MRQAGRQISVTEARASFVYRSTTRPTTVPPRSIGPSLVNLEISRLDCGPCERAIRPIRGSRRPSRENLARTGLGTMLTSHCTTDIFTLEQLSPWLLSLARGGGSHIAVPALSAGADSGQTQERGGGRRQTDDAPIGRFEDGRPSPRHLAARRRTSRRLGRRTVLSASCLADRG